jgi:hypothetical protein
MNKIKLCIVAMFKNEGHIIDEWIEHYLSEGVDHFFLIDHGSTDNYRETIDKYIQDGIINIVVDSASHRENLQVDFYNQYFLKERSEYHWTIICDLDEFIYSRRGFPTIKSYLKRLPHNISQVSIPWKMFGSSDHIQQPDKVVDNFTKRSSYGINYTDGVEWGEGILKTKIKRINANKNKYNLMKSIVRTKDVENYQIHRHTVKYNTICSNQRSDILMDNYFCKINNRILNKSCLHLNHYPIQSLTWFMEVKATRGDSNNKQNVRDINYFRKYDKYSNRLVDNELYNKKRIRQFASKEFVDDKT